MVLISGPKSPQCTVRDLLHVEDVSLVPLLEGFTLPWSYFEGCPKESGPARAAASRGLDHYGNTVQDTADRVMLFFLHLGVLDDVVKLYAKRFG